MLLGRFIKINFHSITVERISLSEVISFHAPKACPKHPAANVSQRVIRCFFKFDSINGRKLLTANLIFVSEAVISCQSRSCLGRVSFSPPSGGLSSKKASASYLCGVSLMLCLTMSCVAGSLYCGQTGGMDRRRFCQGDSSLWHHGFVLPGRPQIGDSRL